jgi:hypothetical protein
MMRKRADDKRPLRPRRSLASRLLCSALPANLPMTLPEEPWRNENPQGKHRPKRKR